MRQAKRGQRCRGEPASRECRTRISLHHDAETGASANTARPLQYRSDGCERKLLGGPKRKPHHDQHQYQSRYRMKQTLARARAPLENPVAHDERVGLPQRIVLD